MIGLSMRGSILLMSLKFRRGAQHVVATCWVVRTSTCMGRDNNAINHAEARSQAREPGRVLRTLVTRPGKWEGWPGQTGFFAFPHVSTTLLCRRSASVLGYIP